MAEKTYRIGAAATLSGVPEQLIRAWERRYGLMSPERTPGGYRVYSERDIALLRRLKQLTEEGVAIGEAVKLLPQLEKELATPEETGARDARLAQWRQRIVEAAAHYDQQVVEHVLDEVLAALTPLAAFDQLMVPALYEVGELWHQERLTVAQEHLVTHTMRSRLLGLLHAAPTGSGAHVVCACLPDEDHELGLLGAALRFRDAGWRVTYLGARTPVESLGRLVDSTRVDCVALSAVNDTGAAPLARALEKVRKAVGTGPRLVVGGAAANAHPERVRNAGAVLEWEAGKPPPRA